MERMIWHTQKIYQTLLKKTCIISFLNADKNNNRTLEHKSNEATDKENYGPISVLPLQSKIFERLIH